MRQLWILQLLYCSYCLMCTFPFRCVCKALHIHSWILVMYSCTHNDFFVLGGFILEIYLFCVHRNKWVTVTGLNTKALVSVYSVGLCVYVYDCTCIMQYNMYNADVDWEFFSTFRFRLPVKMVHNFGTLLLVMGNLRNNDLFRMWICGSSDKFFIRVCDGWILKTTISKPNWL